MARLPFPQGKEAHTLWLQIAAELGLPGLAFLAAYYVLTVAALWKYHSLGQERFRWFNAWGDGPHGVCLIGWIYTFGSIRIPGGLGDALLHDATGTRKLETRWLEEATATRSLLPSPSDDR